MLDPVGKLIKDAWELYKNKAETVLKVWIAPVLITMIGSMLSRSANPGLDLLGGLLSFLGSVAVIIAGAGIILVYDKGVDVNGAYRQGGSFFWKLVFVDIIGGLAVFGASVLLIAPGIIIMVWMLLCQYMVVIEGRSGLGALTQSREYARGYWWQLFGRYLIVVVLYILASIVVGIPIGLIFGRFGSDVAGLIVSFVLTPFLIAYMYRLYRTIAEAKPELAANPSSANRNLFMGMAIWGAVVAIALIVVFSVLAAMHVFDGNYRLRMQNGTGFDAGYGVTGGYPTGPLGASTTTN